ncbi:MAG: hypothetical protein WBP12_03305 [Candidatus Saccharimonas sp.]
MRDLDHTPSSDTEARQIPAIEPDHNNPELDETAQSIQSGLVAAKSIYDYQQLPHEGCER